MTARPRVSDEVLDRVLHPDFDRWRNRVAMAGGCVRPIQLRGTIAIVDPTTGVFTAEFDTSDEPDGVLYLPCGDRRASRCPACAEVYRQDTYHLVRAGLVGGKGVPDTVATHPALFVTLTAPSFGLVHTRVAREGQVLHCRARRDTPVCPHCRPLSCVERHERDDPRLGKPLCADCYDYDAHVVWNSLAPELWRRTTIAARRALDRTAKRCGVAVRVRFLKVAEYQARGSVHFHVIIRLDGQHPADPGLLAPPPVGVTSRDLEQAMKHAVASTSFRSDGHPDSPDGMGWPIGWGTQLDIRPVRRGGADDEYTDGRVAGYLAKYATKSVEPVAGAGVIPEQITERTIRDYANPDRHRDRLIQACWRVGRVPGYAGLRRWAHTLGFGGHFATKSRVYSTTHGALRAERRAWNRRSDSELTVVGALACVGVGWHGSGDAWLAETAAASAREQRRIAREESLAATA